MKASELKGRAVISLADAQKVGEVDNVLVDCSQNQVVGLRIKHGLFTNTQMLRAADIHSVGPDAITIATRELLVDRETASDLQALPDLSALNGITVVSESGTVIGALDDVDVDSQTLAVTAYYLGGSLWEHLTQGTKRFPSTPGLRFGGKLLIIPESLAATLHEDALAAPAPPLPEPTPTPTPDDPAAALPTDSPAPLDFVPLSGADIAPLPDPPAPSAPPDDELKARTEGGMG